MSRRTLAGATVTALVAATAVAATAGTLSRTAAAAPSSGSATSTLTLLSLVAGAHTVEVGDIGLVSDTTSGSPVAKAYVTPILADGHAYGTQTVTPADSPASVAPVATPGALAGLLAATSPAFGAHAGTDGGPHSDAGATSLGSLRLLGLPIALEGTLASSSAVTPDGGAVSDKTVTLRNLRLPDVASLLAALGLDLSKLPAATLAAVADRLGVVDSTISAAEAALASATAAVAAQLDAAHSQLVAATNASTAAGNDLAAKTAAAANAQTGLTQAQSAATAATAAVNDANAALGTAGADVDAKLALVPATVLATLPAGAGTRSGYAALTAAQRQVVESAVPGTAAAYSSFVAANAAAATTAAQAAAAAAAVGAAQTAVATANTAVGTARTALVAAEAARSAAVAALAAVTGNLAPQAQAVVDAVTARLATLPLLSLDTLQVETASSAARPGAGGQSARVVGGQVSGLSVLGNDVLHQALGSSTVNVTALVGSTLSSVQSAIGRVTAALSGPLSNVPSLPSLSVPAPRVDLLTSALSTGTSNGFGTAQALAHALTVTVPGVTIPAAVVLPGAAALPAITGLQPVGALPAAADLLSRPLTLAFGSVAEQAAFRPAVAGAPTTGTPAAGTPTAGTPTAGTPTAGTPTAGTPTAGTPGAPAGTPTGRTPGTTPARPQLPKTGGSSGVAVVSFVLVGVALVARRRFVATR